MSGFDSTKPHYVFGHDLQPEVFDLYAKSAPFDREKHEMRSLSLQACFTGGGVTTENLIVRLLSIDVCEESDSNLQFSGEVDHGVAGERFTLIYDGYIARHGTGVMWARASDPTP